jgi:hypothetical protein
MKKIFAFIAVAALVSSAAFAEGSGGPSASAGQQQQSAAIAGASNQGNAQSITFVQEAVKPLALSRTITDFNQNYSGSYDIKNVPAVVAPALTSSNDTCMGSTSIGGAGVGFGISIGSSWTDDNCVMLKNSRELYNMGMKGAAMARMCMDEKNKEALELTGFVCPQTTKAKEQQAAQQAAAQ